MIPRELKKKECWKVLCASVTPLPYISPAQVFRYPGSSAPIHARVLITTTVGMALPAGSIAAIVLAIVLVLALAFVAWDIGDPVTLRSTLKLPPSPPHASALDTRGWVVIGAGMTTAALCVALRDAHPGTSLQVREAEVRAGGRALSTVPPLGPVSTQSAPREFAAWITRTGPTSLTSVFLERLGVPTLPLTLVTPSTFVWDGTSRLSFAPLTPDTASDLQWVAHTGFSPKQVPKDLLLIEDLPATATVPAAFGWQDVVLRGLGTTPITYGRVLDSVEVDPGTKAITLRYASGDVEQAHVVVLTLSPIQLLQVRGLPQGTVDAISTNFLTISEGVLYATWADPSWMSAVGFRSGFVMAPTLPIGRMCITSPGQLRCTTSGDDNVRYWNDMLVMHGQDTAAEAVASQLSSIFNTRVPRPNNVAFRGWHNAVGFWTVPAGPGRTALQATLTRPWGRDVPIYWASSDLSNTPGWVEGAIDSGTTTATTLLAQHRP